MEPLEPIVYGVVLGNKHKTHIDFQRVGGKLPNPLKVPVGAVLKLERKNWRFTYAGWDCTASMPADRNYLRTIVELLSPLELLAHMARK